MRLRRRTFLQQAALGVLGLGAEALVPELLQNRFKNYWQAAAEPTNRKLALLVGIDRYRGQPELQGCITDIELQQELLIHRFGFAPSDIVVLKDKKATADNIKTAFEEHLIKQAEASHVVVFHFSGYGSQIALDVEQAEARLVNRIVPVDQIAAKEQPASYLLESDLLRWANQLKTQRATLVLDTGYKSSPTIGNLRSPSSAGFAQSRSLPTVSLTPEQSSSLLEARKNLSQKLTYNTLLLAGGEEGTAYEIQWNGFNAGVFTYALTQYLWQVMPASRLSVALTRTAQHMAEIVGRQQRPSLQGQNPSLYTYYLLPPLAGAEAVVSAVENNNNVQVELVGLPAQVLASYSSNACFKLVQKNEGKAKQGKKPYLQLRSLQGLTAKAQWLNTGDEFQPAEGQLLQEWIRVLPRNLELNIVLDENLDRIERVDATSAFSSIKNLATIVKGNDQAAEYLFARVASDQKVSKTTDDNASTQGGGYALFAHSGNQIGKIIAGTNQAVKSAVENLEQQLKYLLALKLLHLTENETNSGLNTQIIINQLAPAVETITKQQTGRAAGTSSNPATNQRLAGGAIASIAAGSQIGVQISNDNDFPIYPLLLFLDSNRNLTLFCPPQIKEQKPLDVVALSNSLVVAPKQTLDLADSLAFNWVVSGPTGLAEAIIISSTMPFQQTFTALLKSIETKTDQAQLVNLTQPLPITKAIMEDLHNASQRILRRETESGVSVGGVDNASINFSSDVYALDVNCWASVSWVYEVVK